MYLEEPYCEPSFARNLVRNSKGPWERGKQTGSETATRHTHTVKRTEFTVNKTHFTNSTHQGQSQLLVPVASDHRQTVQNRRLRTVIVLDKHLNSTQSTHQQTKRMKDRSTVRKLQSCHCTALRFSHVATSPRSLSLASRFRSSSFRPATMIFASTTVCVSVGLALLTSVKLRLRWFLKSLIVFGLCCGSVTESESERLSYGCV